MLSGKSKRLGHFSILKKLRLTHWRRAVYGLMKVPVFVRSAMFLIGIVGAACWPYGRAEVGTPSVLVEYSRIGGIAGLDDLLVVDSNGRATLTRRTSRSDRILDTNTMDQLISYLEKSNFAELKDEYVPARGGSDLLEYRITYQGKTVRMQDTAVPKSILPVLELLNQIIANSRY